MGARGPRRKFSFDCGGWAESLSDCLPDPSFSSVLPPFSGAWRCSLFVFDFRDLTVAGSAVQYLAQQPITVAILKDTNMHPVKDNYRFGVLFDGSACSEKVLRKTLSMMADVDRLTTITVKEQGIDTSKIEAKINEICGERAHDQVTLNKYGSHTVKEKVKEYLREQDENDAYIDFICVGNRGLNVGNAVDGENYLGTVAQAMIGMRRLNVIFVP